MKPFVILLKSPRKFYFYDINQNDLVEVSSLVYDNLQKMLNTDDFPLTAIDDNDSAIKLLMQNGYLKESNVQKLEHSMADSYSYFVNRKMSKIALQLTQDCNFRCKYCVYSEYNNHDQRIHSNKKMSFEVAEKALIFFNSHSVDSEGVTIGFYGGEPLLQFDLIRRIVEYAEVMFSNKKLTFTITTNGSMLSENVVCFLLEHKFLTTISIDGVKKTNDANRVFKNGEGTYSKVIKNIYDIKENHPEYIRLMSVNMVVDPRNDYDEIESFKNEHPDLLSNGLAIRTANMDDTYFDKKLSKDEMANFWAKSSYNDFLSYLAQFGRVSKKYSSIISSSVIDHCKLIWSEMKYHKVSEISVPGGPCLPGVNRLFIDTEGKIFPCERVSELVEDWCLGDLETGINIFKALKMLNISQMTEDECKKCYAFNLCTACIRGAEVSTEVSREQRLKECEYIRNGVMTMLRTIILFHEAKYYYMEPISFEL